MQRYVYLAGPIAALTEEEAKSWRTLVTERLAVHSIIGVSPLRSEPPLDPEGTYDNVTSRRDLRFGSTKAINAKNQLDVRMADLVLAHMPWDLNRVRLSVGTIYEMAWASAAGKPVILVTDDTRLAEHPLVIENTGWILGSFDDAIDVILGLLNIYAPGTAGPYR